MVSIFAEFCESTSAHGFLDFSKATGRCLRSFWALIIAISFVTIGYFVCQVVDDYLSAPLITNSVQNYSKTMVIPYAAVCNPAILNTTKLEEDGFPVETIYSIIKYYNTYSFGQDSNLYNELYHSSMKADFLRRMESVLGEKNFTKFILKYAYPCEKIFSEVKISKSWV